MPDPISIAGLVLAIVGVIQGGGRVFSKLWDKLKRAFGGLRSQSKSAPQSLDLDAIGNVLMQSQTS